jgi:hypothetical protein
MQVCKRGKERDLLPISPTPTTQAPTIISHPRGSCVKHIYQQIKENNKNIKQIKKKCCNKNLRK